MREALRRLFVAAVSRATRLPGLRRLESLLNKTKRQNKTLRWFWDQIDDVADWLIGICVDEIIDDLAQEIVDHNPGISYSDAKAYVKGEYKSVIKGAIDTAIIGEFNALKRRYNDCSAREAAQGCVDNWDGIFAEMREAAEAAAHRTYETWSGEYEDWS